MQHAKGERGTPSLGPLYFWHEKQVSPPTAPFFLVGGFYVSTYNTFGIRHLWRRASGRYTPKEVLLREM